MGQIIFLSQKQSQIVFSKSLPASPTTMKWSLPYRPCLMMYSQNFKQHLYENGGSYRAHLRGMYSKCRIFFLSSLDFKAMFSSTIDASFLEIPDIPENFPRPRSILDLQGFTSFQNKGKNLKENDRVIAKICPFIYFGNSQQRMHVPSEGNPAVRSVRLVVSQNILQRMSKSIFQYGLRV